MPEDDGMDEAFKGFGEDKVTPPVAIDPPATPPIEPPAQDLKPVEEPKKDEQVPAGTPPADSEKKEETPPQPDSEKKPEESAKPPEASETPPAPAIPPEEPKPLTKDDVASLIRDMRTEDRTSAQALDETTKEVLNAYYPEGLSNVLVDKASGKELKTPADVVAVTNGEMTTEEATQWLMNEQFKLDQDLEKIRNDAKGFAETTLKFKQDGVTVLQKYDPLFKKYPQLQTKTWDQYKKLVKADEAKGVVLSAPDMIEFYDMVLEPYRLAFEHSEKQPGTAITTPPEAPPATPGAADRMDESGDGGPAPVNDPNDFGQQVSKELAKGL